MEDRAEGIARLEAARQTLRVGLFSLDRHLEAAKTGSTDEVHAVLQAAEDELELALRSLRES
jgi:hypothetical protein